MQLRTILTRIQEDRSFVYGKIQWGKSKTGVEHAIEVAVQARSNSRPSCSGCHVFSPGYDTLPQRRFEFVPRRPARTRHHPQILLGSPM